MQVNKFKKIATMTILSSILLSSLSVQGKTTTLYSKTIEDVNTIKTTEDFKTIIKNNVKDFNDDIFSIQFKYPYYFNTEVEMKQFIEDNLKYPLSKDNTFSYYNIQKYQYQYKYTTSNKQYVLREVLIDVDYYNSKEDMMLIDKKINDIVLPEINKLTNDYDKIKYIFKYVTNNLEYKQLTSINNTSENEVLERNILNGLENKGAVCVTYALFLDRILTLSGFESLLIEGKVEDRAHLWNMIKINNVWYHLDATSSDVSLDDLSKKIKELNPKISQASHDRTLWKSYSANFYKTFLVSDSALSSQKYTWDKENSPISNIDYVHPQ